MCLEGGTIQTKKIAEAFEYLKCLPIDVQKEAALQIINLLQEAETK